MKDLVRFTVAFLVCAAIGSGSATAHDFWLAPSSFQPSLNQPVTIGIFVGHAGQSEAVPRKNERIVRFDLIDPAGHATPIDGVEGANPAGVVRCAKPGPYQVVFRTNWSRSELAGEKFEEYLGEKGLDDALRTRQERGQSEKPGREVYFRSVKTLLCPAERPASLHQSRPAGLEVEIVPARCPCTMDSKNDLAFQVLLNGKPLPGALVKFEPLERPSALARRAAPTTQDAKEQSARTDDKGMVAARLGAGDWLVSTVYMRPAPANANADWESIWSSVTFEIASAN